MSRDPDVIVIGAGPNGLVAAARLAQAGLQVLVLEANEHIGGAVRTEELTLPGFRHDPFSAFYPFARVGPIADLPLQRYGLEWCDWHRPYGGGTPTSTGVAQEMVLDASIRNFERAQAGDGTGWRELFGWWEWGGEAFLSLLFHPLGHPAPLFKGAPLLRAPGKLFEFAQLASGSARAITERFFRGEDASVWVMGSVLHSDLIPDDAGGGGFGLILCGLSQQVGMPIPRGGAQAIPDALASLLHAYGARILTGDRATRIVVRNGRAVAVKTATGEYSAKHAIVATVQPQALFLDLIGEHHLSSKFVKLVDRYRWGTGVFQLNCALSGLPQFRGEQLQNTLVVHLARSVDELSRSAMAARRGALPAHPLLIAGFHTLADPTRAPVGKHTLWVMTHVPSRIRSDDGGAIASRTWGEAKAAFTQRILDEIEAFAPGFRSLVLATHAQTPEDLERANSNLVSGDIGTGSYTLDQQLVFRPLPGWFRYRTPLDGLYISGAATHPGGGVHGAAGANAARVVLSDLRLGQLSTGLARAASPLSSLFQSAGHAFEGLPHSPLPKKDRSETRLASSSTGVGSWPSTSVVTAAAGVGPLLQHDYSAVIALPTADPEDLIDTVRSEFSTLASQLFAQVSGPAGKLPPLHVDTCVQVTIPLSGTYGMVVVHCSRHSVTLRTLTEHPEPGRITFGAEHTVDGNVIFRIRSRVRAKNTYQRIAQTAAGKYLQSRQWTDFIRRLVEMADGRVIGQIHEHSTVVQPTRDDLEPTPAPTILPGEPAR